MSGKGEYMHPHKVKDLQYRTGKVTKNKDGKLNSFIMLGGILEVQPKVSTILGDSVIRAENLDEAAAVEARNNSERLFSKRESNIDYAKVKNELAIAVAQLRLIRKLKDRR